MPTITIQKAYHRIKTEGKPFALKFVRSTGKKRGSVKTVDRAFYGSAQPRDRQKAGKSSGKAKQGVGRDVLAGVLRIHDLETEKYMTPKFSHIIQFNQFKVIH